MSLGVCGLGPDALDVRRDEIGSSLVDPGIALVCDLRAASVAMAGVSAADLQLALPLVCSPEDHCSIQNHVDLKPGPGAQDFGCGVLTYDGHRGTDFQVRDVERMRAGVPVVAAAPGVVRSARDAMPDTGKKAYDATF